MGASGREFAAIVDATLNDPRGWSLGGTVRFRRASRGSFQVSLAAPAVVGSYGGCSSFYSCRAGSRVLINADRWREATPSYPGAELLHPYRQMVINHEVGHILGFGHANCRRAGAGAPVMQQQSKSLLGCERNSFPRKNERALLAGRLGVRVTNPGPSVAPGEQIGPVALGDRSRDVSAALGTPTSDRPASATYRTPRIRVDYTNGVVASVTTRSPEHQTASGIGVGTRRARLVRAYRGELQCTSSDAGTVCVLDRSLRPGDASTAFGLENGRVTRITVEAL